MGLILTAAAFVVAFAFGFALETGMSKSESDAPSLGPPKSSRLKTESSSEAILEVVAGYMPAGELNIKLNTIQDGTVAAVVCVLEYLLRSREQLKGLDERNQVCCLIYRELRQISTKGTVVTVAARRGGNENERKPVVRQRQGASVLPEKRAD